MESAEQLTTAHDWQGLTVRDIVKAVRVRQWAKNALLLAGFIFAGYLREPAAIKIPAIERVLLAVLCFCCLSAAAYLINDWSDIERDRLHPLKKHRPLASGRMSIKLASLLIVLFLIGAVVTGFAVWLLNHDAWGFPLAALLYFGLTLAYSYVLKHEVVIDVLSVAAGFVVRVVAGCLAVPVHISEWIIFCTFTLALFIALCKRRAELLEMGENSANTRKVLPMYNVQMLDTFIAVAAGLTIMAYSLYTFQAHHTDALGKESPALMTTIPFVVYGVFRYLWLAHSSPVGGEPERMLRDGRMVVNVFLWGVWVAMLTILQK